MVQTSPSQFSYFSLFIGWFFIAAVAISSLTYTYVSLERFDISPWFSYLIFITILTMIAMALVYPYIYSYRSVNIFSHLAFFVYTIVTSVTLLSLIRDYINTKYRPEAIPGMPEEAFNSYAVPLISILFIVAVFVLMSIIYVIKSELPAKYRSHMAMFSLTMGIVTLVYLLEPEMITESPDLLTVISWYHAATMGLFAIAVLFFIFFHEYEIVLTNRRVFVIEKFLERTIKSVPYTDIDSLLTKQGFIGTKFDYGTVYLIYKMVGRKRPKAVTLHGIKKPYVVERVLFDRIQVSKGVQPVIKKRKVRPVPRIRPVPRY